MSLRGKSLTATARDIADGYTIVNPLFLKPLDAVSLKGLYQQVMKVQTEIRGEKFPFNDVGRIRSRNMKLQRLHTTLMIIKNFARERRMKGVSL
ncbi:MAG TPA: hypothetical protein ENH31_08745 [Nitrospirae bacterium]|nr:hypothetical protein [Nitrospirota bacterium]HDK16894.1 hypothetical protein [Nitrospirota bacterium]HDK82637.1 hypothetical protein [Nitrospirota bacterium]